MLSINKKIQIKRTPAIVFALLRNFSKFPSFIQGVKSISTKSHGNNTTVSSWRVSINDTPIQWTQLDSYDDENFVVNFKMIEGDFGEYHGRFSVKPNGLGGSILSFECVIEWDLGAAESLVAKLLENKAKMASVWMLRKIRNAINENFQPLTPGGSKLPIESRQVEFPNSAGRKIVGYIDRINDSSDQPVIIIPPGYGETKRDSITTAYYLANNGFTVLRYDATNHVGESDGSEIDTSMGSFFIDLQAAIDFIDIEAAHPKIGIVSSSLAKRVSLRVASLDSRVRLLVSVVGIVNLRATLSAVYHEDMIGSCLEGRKWQITDVLGLRVSGEFLNQAIEDEYHTFESTISDAAKLKIPVVFLVAEKDAWVKLDDVKLVYETLRENNGERHAEFHLLENTPHNIYEQSRTAIQAVKQICVSCNRFLLSKDISPGEICSPSIRSIAIQNGIEKERLSRHFKSQLIDETSFWSEYLSTYFILSRSNDYGAYIADLFDLLGLPHSYERILDAGCGNGNIGSYLILNSDTTKNHNGFTYCGVDFVEKMLDDCRRIHESLLKNVNEGEKRVEIKFEYYLCDLEKPLHLPVADFDKACLSLVLSYLDDPISALMRIKKYLRKNGALVVSSLKPHCDLSLIYKNFVKTASSEVELIAARNLLSNAGLIKQKESAGLYRFYTEQELKAILISVGFKEIKTRRSFGNQANIALGIK